MKIVLFTLNSKFIHSSLALRYLQTALEEHGLSASRLELQINDDPRGMLAALAAEQPGLLACSCYIWNIEQTLALVRDLKQVMPDLVVVLGGPEAGTRPLQLLEREHEVDFVISGEGELALPQLLLSLDRQGDPVPGLFGRQHPASNYPAEPMAVDHIPLAYRPEGLGDLQHKLVYVETSRGCPFRCSYCLPAGERLRFFPLQRVFRELAVLLQTKAPLIKFVDRTFNAKPDRALEIMRWLLAHRQQSSFHFEVCADLLTEELLDFLAEVPPGIFQFEIGVQSTNRDVLQAIGRSMNWDKLAGNVQRLREFGNINLHLDLIAGLPKQSWTTLQASFDQVMSLWPDQLQLGFLKVLPGTPMAEQAAAQGMAISSRPPYEVLRSTWLSFEELNRLHVVEQLLESYYNSGLLRETLLYRWAKVSPFADLEQFSAHWEERGLHRVNHNQEALIGFFADWVSQDAVSRDLLVVDRARQLPSYPSTWRLPNDWRAPWDDYLNQHLEEFAPRNYKQTVRSVFPVKLSEQAAAWYGQPKGTVAVVDHSRRRLHGFTELE
jgi:radical SAM superfamily enzyme YgiQ (UPF0313 family)